MKFGIFDQNDAGVLPFAEHYEARLQLCEADDRLGFTTDEQCIGEKAIAELFQAAAKFQSRHMGP